MVIRTDGPKGNLAIDSTQAVRHITFTTDAEGNIAVSTPKLIESRLEPQVRKVRGGYDVNFIAALQVQQVGDLAQFLESGAERSQRGYKFRRSPQA